MKELQLLLEKKNSRNNNQRNNNGTEIPFSLGNFTRQGKNCCNKKDSKETVTTSRIKITEIIIQFQYGTGKEKLGYLKYDPISLPTLISLCIIEKKNHLQYYELEH